MARKPRNDFVQEAIEQVNASDVRWVEEIAGITKEQKAKITAEHKTQVIAELNAELAPAVQKEQAKIKAQPKARIQRAQQILREQLRPKERDPLEPIVMKDGSWRYGPGHADIVFKPNGNVALMRGSESLKADWKSVAGRLGALADDPNDPNEKEIARLKDDLSLTKEERAKRIDLLRKVKQKKQRAPLDEIVFELAMLPFKTEEKPDGKIEVNLQGWADSEATRETLGHMLCASDSKLVELSLSDTNMALFTMLSEPGKDAFERKLDPFIRQIRAAWVIRHKTSIHQSFLIELKKLAQKRYKACIDEKKPPEEAIPTKCQLAKALGVDESRMSKLCKELGFDWLPNEKTGPKPSKWRQRRKSWFHGPLK